MSAIKVTTEKTVTITMDGEYADKLSRAIGRVLDTIDKLPFDTRMWLVNTSTVDHLLSFKLALSQRGG